jgi:hypothetical protein
MITDQEHTTAELLEDLADRAEELAEAALSIKALAQAAQRRSQPATWELVEAVNAFRLNAGELVEASMHTAHAAGLSWTDLGDWHDISRQAAAAKWSADALKRKHWAGWHEANPQRTPHDH